MKKIIFLVLIYILTITTVYGTEKNTVTWESLGIGVHNKGEITDWTYFGIKSPKEAASWIDAFQPLGAVSYAGTARIWKQNGYTADEAKEWIAAGLKSPGAISSWKNAGINSTEELQRWKSIGIDTSGALSAWINAGFYTPESAKKCLKISLKDPMACRRQLEAWKQEKVIHEDVSIKRKKEVVTTTAQTDMSTNGSNKNIAAVEEISKTIAYNQNLDNKNNSDLWNLFLLLYFTVMIVAIFKGYGENRTVVIFRDYNDLGLTFLIPASFMLVFYLFMVFGGNSALGIGLATIVALILFSILLKNTYEDNGKKLVSTILAIMTKVPLGIIWIFSFISMLNPSGKTAAQRRKDRASALVIMGLLTPIIGMLVVNKEGSHFNPRDWIKGRRIGSIRKHI
jgi:hypothetical protein